MAKRGSRGKGKQSYVQAERATDLRVRVKRPHVAQEYQDNRSPDVAFELVRNLKDRFQRAVLGNKIRKPKEAHSA